MDGRRTVDRVAGAMSGPQPERRRHPRVKAPVLYRRAGTGSAYNRRQPEDVSLGGLRVRSDDYVEPGSRMDVELLLPDHWLVICPAEVRWVHGEAAGGRESYVVGLQFLGMAAEDRKHLEPLLAVQ
jgi:c-di-GMP-binding flagellar brake protein YcgR